MIALRAFEPPACPACGASWMGDEIPLEERHHYGPTHFRRCIRIYDMSKDTTVAYACPDCKALFDRWSGARLPECHPNTSFH